jgi:heat shock protein HslJ
MKPVLFAAFASLAFVHCGPPKLTNTGEPTATTRFNSGASPTINKSGRPDTVAVTGSAYLQVLGRNENGMYPDLEGSWELVKMPEGDLTSNKNIINEVANAKTADGKPYTGTVMSESMKGAKEIRRDSSTVKSKQSSTTTTTVYLVNDEPENKITPAQGTKYHLPEKPSLNLFGSNETFSGFTGCNRIAGRYTLAKNHGISFSHSAASTRMACIGDYNEQVFLNALKRVNKYKSTGTELQLMDGNDVLFVFARK